MSFTLGLANNFIWLTTLVMQVVEVVSMSFLMLIGGGMKCCSTYFMCGIPNILNYPVSILFEGLICCPILPVLGLQTITQYFTGCFAVPLCGVNNIANLGSCLTFPLLILYGIIHECLSLLMCIPGVSMCVYPIDVAFSISGGICAMMPNMLSIIFALIMGIPNYFIQGCLGCLCEGGILGIGVYANPQYCELCQMAGGGVTQQAQQIGVSGCSSLSQMQNILLMPPVCISQVVFGGINTLTQQCLNPIIVFWNSCCASVSSLCGSGMSLVNLGLGALNIITGPFT